MRVTLVFIILLILGISARSVAQIPYIDSREVLLRGISLYDSGEYKKALEQFRMVHECDTNYTTAVYEQVLALVADSSFEKGKQLALAGLQLPGANKREFMLALAGAYDYLLQTDTALALFDSLARLYPHDHQPIYEQGVSWFRKKQYDKALACFQRSAIINPQHFRTHYMMGRTYAVQGRLTESMMALETSLLLTNVPSLAKQSIGFIAGIVEETDEMNNYYTAKKEQYSHPLFDDIDQIVNAKLALNKAYKLKMDINDNIFRQTQAIMEKLKYDATDTNFAMQYYVPLLKQLYDNEQFEAYILLLFSDFGFDNIDALAKKKKNDIEEVRNVVFPYLKQIQVTRVLNFNKRKEARKLFHYYPSSEVIVAGELTGTGKEEKFRSDVIMYRSSHTLYATGRYNNNGEKDGEWKYYYSSGLLKTQETYKNGVLYGTAKEYYSNGNLKKVTILDNEGSVLQQDNYDYKGWLSNTSKQLPGNQSEDISYYSNGTREITGLYEGKKVKDGAYNFYYPSGKIKKKVSFKKNVYDGPYKEYYESGALSEEGTYDNGNVDGQCTVYFENGKIQRKINYSNGKAEGPYEDYHDNGMLAETGTYNRGMKDGQNKKYDKKGRLFEEIEIRNNVPVSIKYTDANGKIYYDKSDRKGLTEYTLYYDNGNKAADMRITHEGIREGKTTSYYATGQISEEVNYTNGSKEGPSLTTYKNGNKRTETNYKGDLQDGYYKAWFTNGNLMQEGWYKADIKQGLWRYYHANGKLKNEIYYINDVFHGWLKGYNLNGELLDKYIYDYGMLTGYVLYDSTGRRVDSIPFPQGNGHYAVAFSNCREGKEWEFDLKNGLNEGPYTLKYCTGALSEQGQYKNDKKDSLIISYFPNGKIRKQGMLLSGQRYGRWAYYDDAGALIGDEECVNGMNEGKRSIYSGGKVRIAYNYHKDEKDGAQIYYGEDNKIAFVLYYDEDDITGYSYTGKDGQLIPEIPISNATATIKTYYSNGQASGEISMRQRLLNGPFKVYYSNGKLAEDKNYVNNDLEGAFKRYNADGKLCYEVNYKNDEEMGTETTYNSNGEVVLTKEYYWGIPNGKTTIIDPATQKARIFTYHYGTLIAADK